jgi:hypothetical protein
LNVIPSKSRDLIPTPFMEREGVAKIPERDSQENVMTERIAAKAPQKNTDFFIK